MSETKFARVTRVCKQCGAEFVVFRSQRQARCSRSCKDAAQRESQRVDISGRRFWRLVVVRFVEMDRHRRSMWEVLCDCGNRKIVAKPSLLAGLTKSCGCLHAPHGETRNYSQSTEHRIWSGMIRRCEDSRDPAYKDYGGRGIRVCARWRQSFAAFLKDMGRRPSKLHSLDRYPNKNGDYEPSNCRWATSKQQARNTRRNRMITFQGQTLCLSEWAERMGVRTAALHQRLAAGWDIGRAITEPFRSTRRRQSLDSSAPHERTAC